MSFAHDKKRNKTKQFQDKGRLRKKQSKEGKELELIFGLRVLPRVSNG